MTDEGEGGKEGDEDEVDDEVEEIVVEENEGEKEEKLPRALQFLHWVSPFTASRFTRTTFTS